MKNNVLKKMLFAFWLIAHCFFSVAQVSVFNNVPSCKSIVRPVDEERTLVYNQLSSTTGQFILHSSSWTRSFQFPYELVVNDFEIDGGQRAWFCGLLKEVPVVGYFDINATFSGTEPVVVAVCDTLTTRRFLSFDRMDIVRIDSIRIALAIVGTMHISATDTCVYPAVFAADFISGSTSWRIWAGYNYDRNVWYTDIAALDSLVIAVGTDSLGQGCYVKTYMRTPDFVSHPCQFHVVDRLYSTPSEGNVLITKSGAMSASTVQYIQGRNSFLNHQINLSACFCRIMDVHSTVYKNAYLLPTGFDTTNMRLQELRYNPAQDYSLLLHKGYHSTSPATGFALSSWLVALDAPQPRAYRLDNGNEYSLGVFYAGPGTPITSGTNYVYNRLDLFYHDISVPNRCRLMTPLSTKGSDIMLSLVDCFQRSYYVDIGMTQIFPIITEETVIVDCPR